MGDHDEDLERVPTDQTSGFPSSVFPAIISCRPPSPDVCPFPERTKSSGSSSHRQYLQSQRQLVVTPCKGSEQAKVCEVKEQDPTYTRKSPTIISVGRGSIESLVAYMDGCKAAPSKLLPTVDRTRYRSYNGIAVQSLTADFPPISCNPGFQNRKYLKPIVPFHSHENQSKSVKGDIPVEHIVLDGFMLLGATGKPLPYDAQCAKLVSKGITHTEVADFKYFSSLRDLDLSDNSLPNMACFSELPSLKKLNLSVNHMSTLGVMLDSAFDFLEVLNLSFNLLSATALLSKQSPLGRLPCLQELDISGNDLGVFPKVLGSFPSLARLLASGNSLESDSIRPLCALKRLKFVDLSKNKISHIPDRAASIGAFPCLEAMDLSHNLLHTTQCIVHLQTVPNLQKVILAGNPILVNERTGIKMSSVSSRHPEEAVKCPYLGDLSNKIVKHETFLEKPQLGSVYAYKTTKLRVDIDNNLEDVADCVIPMVSGEKIVAAFQSVQAQIEGWRGSDTSIDPTSQVKEHPYEDKTFLTGVPINIIKNNENSDPLQLLEEDLPWEWTEIGDPTVRIACALGLDPKKLPMFTGLQTNNSAGAIHALRFAMQHPLVSPHDGEDGSLCKRYMKTTQSAGLKARGHAMSCREKSEVVDVLPTHHTQQLQRIESALSNMKSRLKTVEERLTGEVSRHQCASKKLPNVAERKLSASELEVEKIVNQQYPLMS